MNALHANAIARILVLIGSRIESETGNEPTTNQVDDEQSKKREQR